MAHLVHNHPNDIGSQPIQYRDHLGNGLTPGLSGQADNEDSIGSGGHLETLRKAQQGWRIQKNQIVFLRELVQQGSESRAYQIGCPMRAQSGWQETQVWPALDRKDDILPRQFAGQDIGQPFSRGEPEFCVEAWAPQITIHNQRLLPSVCVGDRKMSRDRRLSLAGSGTSKHN